MASRLERIEKRVSEFNFIFVSIAILVYAFSLCVFPAFFEMAKSLGNTLPEPFMFFCAMFSAIRKHSLLYFMACSTYYVLSLWFIKPAANTVINLGLLLVFALIFLLFGGPFYGGTFMDRLAE